MTLGRKIFLTTLLVVVGVLGGALLITGRRANSAAESSITRALTATRASVEDALTSRSRALSTSAERLAQVPTYRARIEQSIQIRDRSDLLDQADEFRQQLEADWTLITDRRGVLQAWTLFPGLADEPMGEGSLIGLALGGAATEGLWIEEGQNGTEELFQAVGVPIVDPAGAILGVLVAAAEIDDQFLDGLKRHTNSELMLFTFDPDSGLPELALTTLPAADLGEALRSAGIAADSDIETDTTRLLLPTASGTMVGVLGPLRTAGGAVVGGYAGLRSWEQELSAYTQLQQTIFVAFAGGIVLSLLATLLLTREITRPVTDLVGAARRLAEGDYEADVPVHSGDEIGELAGAFDKLARELKEKDQLLEYLRLPDDAATVLIDSERSATVSTLSQTSARLDPGAMFAGRYRIVKVLGTGGMGVVYRAHDTQLDEPVAIKTLRAEAIAADESMLQRFKQEIRLARRITHRNVVRTHDLGDVDGVYYITMELVEGTTLSELIERRGKLPVGVTLTLARQLLRALEVAHEQGIVHRDIKPQNMVVDAGGFLKVMDFGIATLAESQKAPKERLTGVGAILGTPHYMSPEQLVGETIGPPTDIYAAGAVLFECVTGKPPFEAENLPTLIMMHMEKEAPLASDLESSVPREFSGAVVKAMAKRPNERWSDVSEFREALESIKTAEAV